MAEHKEMEEASLAAAQSGDKSGEGTSQVCRQICQLWVR